MDKTQELIWFLIITTAFIILWIFFAYCFHKFKQIEIKCEQQTIEKRMWRNLAEKREKEIKRLKKKNFNMKKYIKKNLQIK